MDKDKLAAQVAADPLDGHALWRLGQALILDGDQKMALGVLERAGRLLLHTGQLPLAIVVAHEVASLDPATADRLVAELGRAYGKGSARVSPEFRRRPPPGPGGPPPGKARLADALALVDKRLAAMGDGPLPSFPLFHALGARPFARLAEVARVLEPRAGTRVIEVGSPGDAFYVVARGTVRVARPDGDGEVVLGHLRAGAFFGEMALLTESPRAAHAICETDSVLLEVPRKDLQALADEEPELAAILAEYTRERLIANLMLTSALFAPLSPDARDRLIRCFRSQVVEPGTTLIAEGQPGETLFIVLSGCLAVDKREQDGHKVRIASLGPSDVFGEISLLTRRPTTASVRAETRSVVLALARDDFNRIVGELPEILAPLYQLAVTREREIERVLADTVVEAEDYLV